MTTVPSFDESPIPVIDLARFRGDDAERMLLAREVDAACREIGFLVIANHGIAPELIAEVDTMGRAFFALPVGTKEACMHRTGSVSRGYTGMRARALARTHDDAKALGDLRESFSMGRPKIDPADPYFSGPEGSQLFQRNVFPAELPGMQPALERYHEAMSDLAEELMRLFALALDLEEHFFDQTIGRHISSINLTNYPHQDVAPEQGQLRAGAHTDFGTLTILRAEDKPGGLEVQTRDGRWVPVPITPNSYIINIGDLMARWTNDRWRSTIHRVANPPADASGSTQRLSIIFFHQPDHDAEIRCLPSCVGDGVRYQPTTSGRHLLDKVARSQAMA